MQVELSELEAAEVNESRKVCVQMGLMWKKPGSASLMDVDEVASYRGPTQCWHRSFGSPCYAPYPAFLRVPSFFTPMRLARMNVGQERKPHNPRVKRRL